jgi:ribosomal protein L16
MIKFQSSFFECCLQALGRFVRKGGQVWVRIFPDIPVSKKPSEVRMGRGKGEVELYIARVPAGKIMYVSFDKSPSSSPFTSPLSNENKFYLFSP